MSEAEGAWRSPILLLTTDVASENILVLREDGRLQHLTGKEFLTETQLALQDKDADYLAMTAWSDRGWAFLFLLFISSNKTEILLDSASAWSRQD